MNESGPTSPSGNQPGLRRPYSVTSTALKGSLLAEYERILPAHSQATWALSVSEVPGVMDTRFARQYRAGSGLELVR